jgi:hypothetical protein
MAKKPAPKGAKKNLPAVMGSRQKFDLAVGGDWEAELAKAAQLSARVGEAVGGTGNWITFRQGVMSYKGLPLQDSQLEAIVLDEVLENLFYEDKFDADAPASPVCYALARQVGDLAPHETAPKPQHEGCKGCPKNEFKSAENKKGKACKNMARLALIAFGDGTKGQIDTCELAFAKIPVTSVKNWAAYTESLRAKFGRGPFGFITRIKCRPDPKNQIAVEFEFVGTVDKKLGPSILKRVEEARHDIIPALPYQQIEREEKPAARPGRRSSKY